MMALHNINHRYYQTLKKKKRMRNKIADLAKGQVKAADTKSVVLTLFVLCLVFAIIAYFKPQ